MPYEATIDLDQDRKRRALIVFLVVIASTYLSQAVTSCVILRELHEIRRELSTTMPTTQGVSYDGSE